MVAGRKLRAVVVGGSIAGLSCAHALLRAGCEVTVLEKAVGSVTAAGAGLGLDAEALAAVWEWNLGEKLEKATVSLTREENRAVESTVEDLSSKTAKLVYKNDKYNHRAAHWSDLHKILLDFLPKGLVRLGHEVISFEEDRSQKKVKITLKNGEKEETLEGDFMVAADGSMSQARQKFLPEDSRRYLGYCAWRGVLNAQEQPELANRIRSAYPDLGNCLYFDIAKGTHAVLYQLAKDRLNWLWYVNQAEPELKGPSVTVKADERKLVEMRDSADRTWVPELAEVMKATPSPFINAIFDRDPVDRFVWGRVVLVGEAAHPTSPHGLRSTNMSIADAAVLGRCIAKWTNQGSSLSGDEDKDKKKGDLGEALRSSRNDVVATDRSRSEGEFVSSQGGDQRELIVSGAEAGTNGVQKNAEEREGNRSEKFWDSALARALAEYEAIRVPVARQEVLFSRYLGQLKQGLLSSQSESFSWSRAGEDQRQQLGQANMKSYCV